MSPSTDRAEQTRGALRVALLYAVLALFLASLTFGNENVITGEKVSMKKLLAKK